MAVQSTPQSLVFAAMTGAVSLVPLWRAPRPVRTALVAGSGLAMGAGVFTVLTRPDLFDADRDPVPAPASAAVGAAAATVAAGAVAVGITADRLLEQFLVRRGVRRPRLVIGVVGFAGSYALDVLDRAFDQG